MRYLFLRENVLFMFNIRFHLPKPNWTPYDNYTKYFFIIGVLKAHWLSWLGFANKIEAMYERSHVSVKVESRSTSRLISTIYIFTWLKFTCFNVHSQKRVKYVEQNKYCYNSWIPRGLVAQAMDFGVIIALRDSKLAYATESFIYLETNAVFLHNFWRSQPTLPYFRL